MNVPHAANTIVPHKHVGWLRPDTSPTKTEVMSNRDTVKQYARQHIHDLLDSGHNPASIVMQHLLESHEELELEIHHLKKSLAQYGNFIDNSSNIFGGG